MFIGFCSYLIAYHGDKMRIARYIHKDDSFSDVVIYGQRCIDDKYWLPKKEDICNNWLYKQYNQYCAKLGIVSERVVLGAQLCCNPLDDIIYQGKKKNVVACVGADIFFNRNIMYNSSVVSDRASCSFDICQFYPDQVHVIRKDSKGNIIYGKQGQPLVTKMKVK